MHLSQLHIRPASFFQPPLNLELTPSGSNMQLDRWLLDLPSSLDVSYLAAVRGCGVDTASHLAAHTSRSRPTATKRGSSFRSEIILPNRQQCIYK